MAHSALSKMQFDSEDLDMQLIQVFIILAI